MNVFWLEEDDARDLFITQMPCKNLAEVINKQEKGMGSDFEDFDLNLMVDKLHEVQKEVPQYLNISDVENESSEIKDNNSE